MSTELTYGLTVYGNELSRLITARLLSNVRYFRVTRLSLNSWDIVVPLDQGAILRRIAQTEQKRVDDSHEYDDQHDAD